jgi:hypothetical protein
LARPDASVGRERRQRLALTNVAARYTNDRRDNFDIVLPLWLARYNKIIFGYAALEFFG